MSKCDLQIVLDEPSGRYKAGSTVTGVVVVNVNAECKCDALTITREWRTHGRGNTNSGGESTETLHEGRFLPGEEHEFKFSVPIPTSPLTYHGELLNIDWYLKARADIPWALDPKAEAEFLVELGDLWTSDDAEQMGSELASDIALVIGGKGSMLLAKIFGVMLVLPGIGMGIAGVLGVTSGDTEMIPLLFMGALFSVVGLLVVVFMVRSTIAERKLGPVVFKVEPRNPCPGQEVKIEVSFQPRSRCKINSIKTTFGGKELVVSGHGRTATSHTHDLLKAETQTLDSGRDIYAGEEVHVESTLEIPEDAPYSFSAPSNSVLWSVKVHVDIASWPDWTETTNMMIGPWR